MIKISYHLVRGYCFGKILNPIIPYGWIEYTIWFRILKK